MNIIDREIETTLQDAVASTSTAEKALQARERFAERQAAYKRLGASYSTPVVWDETEGRWRSFGV